MLHPDKARQALEERRSKTWKEDKLNQLKKLSPSLRHIGNAILGHDAKGDEVEGWQQLQKLRESLDQDLDAMSRPDRLKLFGAFFSKLAETVEAAWQLQHRLPYSTGYARKAFRAPNHPPATRERRSQWFQGLVENLASYDPDLEWTAAWAAHLGYHADNLGYLFAAAIDSGGPRAETVLDILKESASNQHEIGGMGRHVTRALLVCSRPDAWEFIEKLLLAAQRQEGLRQSILETIDEAHPQAFRRMLRLIQDQNLARFSATVRAVNVWFGFQWDSVSVKVVNETIAQVILYLEDEEKRTAVLKKGDAESTYLALWALAFGDIEPAIKAASMLLKDSKVERRFATTQLLGSLGLPLVNDLLLAAIDDPDLRIGLTALDALPRGNRYGDEQEFAQPDLPPDLFEREERLLKRLPEKATTLKALVWPWATVTADRKNVAGRMLYDRGKLPATRLIPYLPLLDSYRRGHAAEVLGRQKKWDAATRDILFSLVRDTAANVREAALKGLAQCKVTPEEAEQLEGYLTRTSADLRRGVLQLLLNQIDKAATASADRLLESSDVNQRLAGLELLRQLAAAERDGAARRTRGEAYRKKRPRLSKEESAALDALAATSQKQVTLDDALGLMNPAERTPVVPPQKHKVTFMTAAAAECLKSLDALIHEQRELPIILKSEQGESQVLLGQAVYAFPSTDWQKPIKEEAARLQHREVWESWWRDRSPKLRDSDGLELVRASVWLGVSWDEWAVIAKRSKDGAEVIKLLSGGVKPVELNYAAIVRDVLHWLLRLHPPKSAATFWLEAAETALALVPDTEKNRVPDPNVWNDEGWHSQEPFKVWLDQVFFATGDPAFPKEDDRRYWNLMHWLDEPFAGSPRMRPDLSVLLGAYEEDYVTDADLLDDLLGSRPEPTRYSYSSNFSSLNTLTAQKPPVAPKEPIDEKSIWSRVPTRWPQVLELVDRCRERILEVELSRGELPTPATEPALALQALSGLDTLVRLLQALGDKPFTRGRRWGSRGQSKPDVLTHLISVTQPNEAETPEMFKAKVQPLVDSQGNEWLIALAFIAPQWLGHVQHALGWPGLDEAVYWYFAHAGWRPGWNEARDKLIRERTSLKDEERAEGAVDVVWFHKTHAALGPKRWQALEAVAKYASDDNSYKKAMMLTHVLLGKAKKSELIAGIRKKNLRESVRLLGLLPLAAGADREKDVEGRYQVMHEYLRYARQLGPMSRESAVRAGTVGMENLARTAGYPDPVRLEWAMEARFIADLAKGPVRQTVNGVTVSLALDPLGKPDMTVEKNGKPLKSIPAEVRKHKKIAELNERKTELKRQASRMRESLESAMIRGDAFSAAELQQLFTNPMLSPTLERLVLLGEDIAGYPVKGGKALENHQGKLEPVKKNESLRLAHPLDLLQLEEWHEWQADCFRRERIQPFKQVFRELYVVTAAEKKDKSKSQRYAGQQVNPSQAMALLGGRGWHTKEGVSKTFHDVGLTASVWFKSGVTTPLEVEGLTLDQVQFHRRDEWKPLPLVDVPPRIFSEVMRDLDLVVSVAHRGGVDPEASASTVEMRASLLRETCSLLGVSNVRLKEPHILIDGELAKYTVHLGSGVVHRMPGGSLCIVPVHAQHRGRLFLPFADDDPRTAEVLSKVLLLARDFEIQDPTILDQIRAKR